MRLVVKVGSAVLSHADGSLNESVIRQVSAGIHAVKSLGHEVLLVSSGAIAAGRGKIKTLKISNLRQKQAAAAIGQLALMEAYENAFDQFKMIPAQVLITREDLTQRQRYLNVRNTLLKLLELDVIPIINENDCVSTDEIQVGDNDTLSAIVAAKVEADKLIILSNVEGLYELDERGRITENLISNVGKMNAALFKNISQIKSADHTVGGMETKLTAAKAATSAGIETWIGSGHDAHILKRIVQGETGMATCFHSSKNKIAARHSWIAFGKKSKGSVVVDPGAAKAIVDRKKSLLPSGIKSIRGTFSVGDTISIKSVKKGELARGLVNFSSDELKKIRGHHSKEIEKILGRSAAQEVVHRDNLVVL